MGQCFHQLGQRWNTEDGKKELLEGFSKSGYNKDLLLGFQMVKKNVTLVNRDHTRPIPRCPCQELMISRSQKRIREKVSETDMWVEGEFVSEADVKGELGMSE